MILLLFIIFSLITAFFVSWSAAGMVSGWITVFFPAAAAIFWFWRLSFSRSLLLALAVGLLWDTFSIMYFGTYLFTFFLLVLTAELLKSFFSNTKIVLSQIVSAPILFLVFFFAPQITQPIFKLLL